MFTVTQRVYLIHIDKISSLSVVDSVENRRNAFLLVAVLQVISTPQPHKNTLIYIYKILKYGYLLAISEAHEKQKTKCLRTVHFNTSSHILQLIRQLRKLKCIRRQKCIKLAAKIH